jgi:hypothetical protein
LSFHYEGRRKNFPALSLMMRQGFFLQRRNGNGGHDQGTPGEKRDGMEVVRLKREWRGHPGGAIVKVSDDCANNMFQRDAAEKIATENNVAIKDKLQRMVADRRLKTFNK